MLRKLVNHKQNEKLLLEINSLRNELISVGTENGLTHRKTLKISQKLDEVLNKYQSINH